MTHRLWVMVENDQGFDKTFLILHERGISKIGRIGLVWPESSKNVFKLFEYEMTFSTDVSFLGKCYSKYGSNLVLLRLKTELRVICNPLIWFLSESKLDHFWSLDSFECNIITSSVNSIFWILFWTWIMFNDSLTFL